MRIFGDLVPPRDQLVGDRWPGAPGFGMHRFVSIAAFVRNPAERPAIRHAHRYRPARSRHARRKERSGREDVAYIRKHFGLTVAVEKSGIKPHPVAIDLQVRSRAFNERFHGAFHGPFSWDFYDFPPRFAAMSLLFPNAG